MEISASLRGALYTLIFFVTSEVVYKLYTRRQRNTCNSRSRKSRSRSEVSFETESESNSQSNTSSSRLSDSSLRVLFFPDKAIACRDYFITGDGCFRDNCGFSHAKTSLSELYEQLMSCQFEMDLCVFLFTCRDLADIISKLYKRGVKIRIITDSEQLNCTGSQIWSLRKSGIPVRVNHTSYLMHHKFVIKDRKVLINGSFNWTVQAITGNQENVIITDDDAVTSLFIQEFQRMWDDFDSSPWAVGH